jgi:hypothetical protein
MPWGRDFTNLRPSNRFPERLMNEHKTKMQQAVDAGYEQGRALRKAGTSEAAFEAAQDAQNPYPEPPLRTAWAAGCLAAFNCRLKPPVVPDPLSPGGQFVVQ